MWTNLKIHTTSFTTSFIIIDDKKFDFVNNVVNDVNNIVFCGMNSEKNFHILYSLKLSLNVNVSVA